MRGNIFQIRSLPGHPEPQICVNNIAYLNSFLRLPSSLSLSPRDLNFLQRLLNRIGIAEREIFIADNGNVLKAVPDGKYALVGNQDICLCKLGIGLFLLNPGNPAISGILGLLVCLAPVFAHSFDILGYMPACTISLA